MTDTVYNRQTGNVIYRSNILFIDTTHVILDWFAGRAYKSKWYT